MVSQCKIYLEAEHTSKIQNFDVLPDSAFYFYLFFKIESQHFILLGITYFRCSLQDLPYLLLISCDLS